MRVELPQVANFPDETVLEAGMHPQGGSLKMRLRSRKGQRFSTAWVQQLNASGE